MNESAYKSPCQTSTIGSSDLGLASKDNLQDKGHLPKMDCVLPSSLVWLCVLLQCILTPVLRIRSPHEEYTNISVIQNTDCECRPRDSDMLRPSRLSTTLGSKKPKKRGRKGKKGMHTPKNARSVCPPCDQRRILNPENCECVCQKNEKKCNQRGLIFNQERCRCEKPRS
ncbi:vascular endothelial growth factor B isoform X3 [Lithobates pipiens]